MIKPVVMTLVQFKDIIKEKSSDELFFVSLKIRCKKIHFIPGRLKWFMQKQKVSQSPYSFMLKNYSIVQRKIYTGGVIWCMDASFNQ